MRQQTMPFRRLALAVAAIGLTGLAAPAIAQDSPAPSGSIEPDGTVVVPSFRLAPSIYLSDEAKKALPRKPTDPEAMMRSMSPAQIGAVRLQMAQIMRPRLNPLKEIYKVITRNAEIAGVPAVYAAPAGGVPKANTGKILLNLPGQRHRHDGIDPAGRSGRRGDRQHHLSPGPRDHLSGGHRGRRQGLSRIAQDP
jgi:hypothetical protein